MRHPVLSLLAVAFSAVWLTGCNYLETDAGRGYATSMSWRVPSAYTTANVRVLTSRIHPVLHNAVLCAEPLPDVALAVGTSGGLNAQGGNGVITAALAGNAASSEAVAELAGRTTALLGLRDGVFRACEAYANGMIGQDVFALVVSRYSELMSTLFLAQDIAHTAPGAFANASSPVLTQPTTGGSSAAAPKTTTTTTTGAAAAQPALATGTGLPLLRTAWSPASVQLVAVKPPAAAKTPAATKAAAAPTAADPKSTATDSSGVAALSITRMNEDLLHGGLTSALVVACINEYDPTRNALRYNDQAYFVPEHPELTRGSLAVNSWLKTICDNLTKEGALTELAAAEWGNEWKPVNPEAGVGVKTSASPAKATSAHAAAPAKANPRIAAVQALLQQQTCPGCDPGDLTGADNDATDAAVRAYQRAHNLTPPNGNPLDERVWTSLVNPKT